MAQPSGAQPPDGPPPGGPPSGAQSPGPAPGDTAPGDAPGDTTPRDTVANTSAPPSLSPSRAGALRPCPLPSRFRGLDRLPEPPSPAAARGPLVHAVLERLFDEPAAGRTPETARAMLAPQWERLIADEPELAGLFSDEEERTAWLAAASHMPDRSSTPHHPTRLQPQHPAPA